MNDEHPGCTADGAHCVQITVRRDGPGEDGGLYQVGWMHLIATPCMENVFTGERTYADPRDCVLLGATGRAPVGTVKYDFEHVTPEQWARVRITEETL